MTKKLPICTFLILFSFFSCDSVNEEAESTEKAPTALISQSEIEEMAVDQHSYANTNDAKTVHLHLNLEADFDVKQLKGNVVHTIENVSGTNVMVFDTKDLTILDVLLDDSLATTYELNGDDEFMGSSLAVAITPTTKRVTIFYETSSNAAALQWLDPQQTAGKEQPYLFTQGEAVLTRTWIPCQDTPGNKITYSADIKVPNHLLAVMSADNPMQKNAQGTYHFEMDQAIPSYLIALAVGDLEFAPIGNRTGVYAEPSMLEKSVYEFADVEKMITAAEGLYGEYLWGRYDIIVLPPSFPYGGMENPKLTFATPTILAGDRSLVSLIAHELAHSWSGNLVTNATWDDFWLNEGFTVYFENRIMEEVFGKEYADMLFSIEYEELERENELILASEFPEDTKLKLDLKGRDPDDGMTTIAYVKGALFLKTLEHEVGREKFDDFLSNYFEEHKFQTMTTEGFVTYLQENLLNPNDIAFNVNQWIYEEGIPQNSIKIESNRFELVEQKAKKIPSISEATDLKLDQDEWSTQEWMHFIRQIPAETTPEKFALMDEEFNFSNCGNAEIMSEWYIKSIQHGYQAINSDMEHFLINVGRRKFLEPIYTELAKTDQGKELGRSIYEKARPNYHSISYNTIDEILNWDS